MEITLQRKDSGNKNHYDAAVIGSGPAGLTASIYLGRAKIDAVLFEKMVPGGYILSTDRIENYPAFPDGIRGEELASLMEHHAEKFGVRIEISEVVDVNLSGKPFIIKTTDGRYTTEAIIIATGTRNKKLNVPGEKDFIGKGISLCATCDAPFFEGEDIVIVGAGNSGIQESLYLSRFAKNIKIIEFLDQPTAEKILLERLKEKDNIELILSHRVTKFIGDEKLTAVEIEDVDSSEKEIFDVKGVFIYAGLLPNSEFLKDSIELDDYGFIKTDGRLRTSVEGVFAAGDVRDTPLRQITTAVGDGAIAAYGIREYLEEK